MAVTHRIKSYLMMVLTFYFPVALGGDLLIENGKLFTAKGVKLADVRIRGETILEIGELEPGY